VEEGAVQIRLADEGKSASRTTKSSPWSTSVEHMSNHRKARLTLYAIFAGLVLLAALAWTVQGVRWAVTGGGGRLAPAT
jgi:hypothetical protein